MTRNLIPVGTAIGIGVLITLLLATAGEAKASLIPDDDIGFWTLWLFFLVTGNALSTVESPRIPSILHPTMVLLGLIAFFSSACGVALALWLSITAAEYRILASVTGVIIGLTGGAIIGTAIGLWWLSHGRLVSKVAEQAVYGITVGTITGVIIASLIAIIKIVLVTGLTFSGMDILKGITSSGATGIVMAVIVRDDLTAFVGKSD